MTIRRLLTGFIHLVTLALITLWIAQWYGPVSIKNTFGNTHLRVRPVTGDLSFIESVSNNFSTHGSTIYRDGRHVFQTALQHAALLPAVGDADIIEVANGHVLIGAGTIADVSTDKFAKRAFAVTRSTRVPLWPPLAAFGLLSAGLLLRGAFHRRQWMVETYRATSTCHRSLVWSFALLIITVTLYLVQLPAPIVLYNGFTPPTGCMGFKRDMSWDKATIHPTTQSIQRHGSMPNQMILSALPEEVDEVLPALGDHWVVAIGNDALELRHGTVTTSKITGNPAWVGRAITAPLNRRLACPLWVGLVLFGGWFIYLAVVPSRAFAHRLRNGLCLRCGYDLRGSSGRCPECGLEPAAPDSPASQASA